MINLLIIILNCIIIGTWLCGLFKREKKTTERSHSHSYGPWKIHDIKGTTWNVIQADYPTKTEHSAYIHIQRICKDCGHIDKLCYETRHTDNPNEVNSAISEMISELESSILYVPPVKKTCEHRWGRRGIVYEQIDDVTSGSITVQRYCLDCGTSDSKTINIPYTENPVELRENMTKTRNHIMDTLINENSLTKDEILDIIHNFANGVEFIEVSQCDILAHNIHQSFLKKQGG